MFLIVSATIYRQQDAKKKPGKGVRDLGTRDMFIRLIGTYETHFSYLILG